MKQLTAIELFAGAGGLGLGIGLAGFTPLKVVENNADCHETLRLNRKKANGPIKDWPSVIDRDVRKQDYTGFVEKIDLVSGGPPCQPFSMGGLHNAHVDERDMFPEAVRAVRECRPKAFLFENVRGMTRESFSAYFEYIRLQMAHPQLLAHESEDWSEHLIRLQRHHTSCRESSDDYRVVTQVLNAADYGVPQQRHRVFFVGLRADLGKEYSFRRSTHSKNALLNDLANGAYFDRVSIDRKSLSLPRQIARLATERVRRDHKSCGCDVGLQPWKTAREALFDLPEPMRQGTPGWFNHFGRDGAKAYPGHTGSDFDFPSKALKAGVHGVPGGENMLRRSNGEVRYFSVRESARLQTFPDDFEVTGSWSEAMRQLGNAVPVELAHVVAEDLRKALVA